MFRGWWQYQVQEDSGCFSNVSEEVILKMMRDVVLWSKFQGVFNAAVSSFFLIGLDQLPHIAVFVVELLMVLLLLSACGEWSMFL